MGGDLGECCCDDGQVKTGIEECWEKTEEELPSIFSYSALLFLALCTILFGGFRDVAGGVRLLMGLSITRKALGRAFAVQGLDRSEAGLGSLSLLVLFSSIAIRENHDCAN